MRLLQRRLIPTRARSAAFGLAAACGVILALASIASAQSTKLGPNVSGVVLFEDGKLIFGAAGGKGAFAGDVTFSATRGDVEWTPFDEPPKLGADGVQAVEKGGVGGVPFDEYFAPDEARRIRIRNGNGATTELDVVRRGELLLVSTANRSPSAQLGGQAPVGASASLDATKGATVTLTLRKGTVSAVATDVVFAARLEPAAGSLQREPHLTATDVESSASYPSYSQYTGAGDVAFYHFALPDGTYRISALDYLSAGNPMSSSAASVRVDLGDLATVSVSRNDRLFAVSLPSQAPPPLLDSTLTLDGIAGFEPSISNRLTLSVSLFNYDLGVQAFAQRDVGDGGPVRLPFRVPAGSYQVSVSVYRTSQDANGTSLGTFLSLGTIEAGPAAEILIPPLVALTGSLLDPEFTLASGSADGPNGIARHTISANGENFSATVTLAGFARGYKFYVPRGTEVSVSASLTAALGKPNEHYSASKNDTGSLQLLAGTRTATCGDGGCDFDVTVPALPQVVEVAGKVVDKAGRPATSAVVSVVIVGLDGDESIAFSTGVVTRGDGSFTLRLPRANGYQVSAFAF